MNQICDMENMRRRLKRVGTGFLPNIFNKYFLSEPLSSEDALKIFNSLGITLDVIFLLAESHGFNGVDEKGFEELLKKQEDSMANSRPCMDKEPKKTFMLNGIEKSYKDLIVIRKMI